MMIPFCRKFSARAKNTQREYVPDRGVDFKSSSPSFVKKYVTHENNKKKKLKCSKYYYKKYTEMINRAGVDVFAD